MKNLPFQGFPGIFSTIDRYNKLIVQTHFQRESALPVWLGQLGEVAAYIDPPHWSSFKVTDDASEVTLRGEADGIFRMADHSYTIVDYKTAKVSRAQRSMFRAYETQLNAYAYIGERLGLAPVSKLALVYMEPQTDEEAVLNPQLIDSGGFSMGFRATIVKVALKPDVLIPPLLRKVKEVSDMEKPPPAGPECKDCQAMDGLLQLLGD